MKKWFKWGDFVIIGVVLLAAFLIWFPVNINNSGPVTAFVYENGQLVHKIQLTGNTENYTFSVGDSMIQIDGESIAFIDASCPDQSCIRFGRLSKPGQTAACVPGGVVIRLEGNRDDLPDAVTY